MPLEISPDMNSIATKDVSGEITDKDTGQNIKVHYRYFGLVGRNITTGSYSNFTNWSFMKLPVYGRPQSDGAIGRIIRENYHVNDLNSLIPGKISSTVSEEDIISVVPVIRKSQRK